MAFKKLIVNSDVIAGEEIENVHPPTPESPTWRIVLKDGGVIEATGNISVWTTSE